MSGKINLNELSRDDLLALWPEGYLKHFVKDLPNGEIRKAIQIVTGFTAGGAQERLLSTYHPDLLVPSLTTIKRNRRHIDEALAAMEDPDNDLSDEPIPYDLVHPDAEIDMQIDAEVGDNAA